MQDKDKTPRQSSEDEKIHISKSVFQNAREMQQNQLEEERRQQEELERQIAERKKRAEEARDKRLAEERRELLRLKTGVIEESETIHEEQEEEIKLSFFQKIGNFFYHNKWWLGMGAVATVIVVYLVYSLASKPRPDMTVLLIGYNQALGEESGLPEYIGQFCADNNGNGEILASVFYIAYSDNAQQNYTYGVDTKLTAELQSADSVIVFGNEKISEILNPDEVFVNLEELYPDNEQIKDYAFMLEGTGFAEKIGLTDDDIDDGWFMAIRTPRKLMYSDKEDMQEIYDRDFAVFDAIINDLSR